MKVHPLLFSAFLWLSQASTTHGALTTLDWNSPYCPSGYAGCADIEFCQNGDVFGYKLAGSSGCGLDTAPVIRMRKGQKYMINLHNNAAEPGNLHTHGLHVGGDGNADDVTRHAYPGECISYTYDLYDHRGGTFWYHDHIHGSTERHVLGGALGMLIVEDDPQDLPNDGAVQAFATDPAYELLLIAVQLGRNNVYANAQLSAENFDLLSDTWYRLRVVAAEASANLLDLTVVGCRAMPVAYDGVWRSTVPGMESSTFQLTGASRMDLAVLCSDNGSLELDGTTIANFNIFDVGSPDLSSPFEGAVEGQTWDSRVGLPDDHYLYDQRLNSVDTSLDISMSGSQISGLTWDPATPLAHMTYNTVQEWTISGTNAHPFHLHVYHMQVVTPGGCGHHEEGEYYDTISGGTCTVRFRMADYGGRVVFHCHVLRHEDNGAMTWVSVDDGPTIDYSNMDSCSGGGGGGGCVPDGSCTALTQDQCGTDEGVDSCGGLCTLAQTPTCTGGQECVAFQCQTPSACVDVGQSCIDDIDCCSGSCSRGNKKFRVCL